MYPEIPALSFISAGLTLVPVICYLRARNIAAVAIGMWLSIVNLTYAVDALIWAEEADVASALVWCDICELIPISISCSDLWTFRSNEFHHWFPHCAACGMPLHLYPS